MSNILQKICEDKSKELEETKKRCSFKTLEKLISSKYQWSLCKMATSSSANDMVPVADSESDNSESEIVHG